MRTALVVGGAGGMGRAAALRLADGGFAVAVADVDPGRTAEVVAAIEARGGRALAVELNLADDRSVDAAVARTRRELGGPWFLGVAGATLEGALALEAQDGHFARVMRVNFLGVARANVAAARAMVADRDGGRIVNWSSINAVGGSIGYAAYAASKAAVNSFTRSLALELAPYGVTVNAILPGSVRTPMLGYLTEEEIAAEDRRIPLGRWGEPEDVAELVAFLASGAAAWITGVTLPVDGGTLVAAGRADVEAVRERLARERAYARENSRRTPGASS